MKYLREIEELKRAATEGTCWTENGVCKECTDLPLCNTVRALADTSKELAEAVVRNLIAWDNSKDKEQGLLPEVYLTNRYLYKQLTGVEYNYIDACTRFKIGNQG